MLAFLVNYFRKKNFLVQFTYTDRYFNSFSALGKRRKELGYKRVKNSSHDYFIYSLCCNKYAEKLEFSVKFLIGIINSFLFKRNFM